MSDMPKMRDRRRAWKRFYSFGRSLAWEYEYELLPGFSYATWTAPAWAQSPHSDIIGEWKPLRKRFVWFGIPLTPWRSVSFTGSRL